MRCRKMSSEKMIQNAQFASLNSNSISSFEKDLNSS